MIITKECLSVTTHDTSLTGIRYKLIVKLGKKPKNMGAEVLDTSNNLYRGISFQYASNPEVQGAGKNTVLVYYFNDTEYANKLSEWLTGSPIDSEAMQKSIKAHEIKMNSEGYPAFIRPYCNGVK